MNKNEIKAKIDEYKSKFQKHRGNIKSLKWANYTAAAQRYKQIVADLNFENKKILDVGCGFGDILSYIKAKTEKFEYTGIDLIDNFIKQAQKRYPEFEFKLGDYFENPLKENFDIILCCGALNSNFAEAINYRKRAIKIMFERANFALSFNMAGNFPQPKNKKSSKVFYADSLEILNYCFTLTNKIIFRHYYHNKDFTIVMRKPQKP